MADPTLGGSVGDAHLVLGRFEHVDQVGMVQFGPTFGIGAVRTFRPGGNGPIWPRHGGVLFSTCRG